MRQNRRSERGFSLIAMLVIVILVGGVASAFMLLSTTESKTVEMNRYKLRATYLAEAAVEDVANLLRSLYAQERIPRPPEEGGAAYGAITINGMTMNYDWYKVKGAGSPPEPLSLIRLQGQLVLDALHNTPPVVYEARQYLQIDPVEVSGELSVTRMYYQMQTDCKFAGSTGHVMRIIEVKSTPLFQFLAFYNESDLEFMPGPTFVGNGRVHSNKDMYLAAGSSMDLYSDHIKAVGQMYRHRKNNHGTDASYTDNDGRITVHSKDGSKSATWGPYVTSGNLTSAQITELKTWESATDLGASGESTPNVDWATRAGTANSAMGETHTLTEIGVKSGAEKIEPPDVGALNPPSAASTPDGGIYFQKANTPESGKTGLIIRDGQVVNWNGGAWVPNSTATADLVAAGAIRTDTVADRRERTDVNIPVTVIDLGALKGTSHYPLNGVLYAFQSANGEAAADGSYAAPSGGLHGVMFTNGSDLKKGSSDYGITLASNGPVYMHGDINSPHVYDAGGAQQFVDDPSNALHKSPLEDSSRKVPTAVIADAVNLLSNGWDGSKTATGTSVPTAKPTNYNFAMVTGNVLTPDGGGYYSGGLENLPRFHEDWNANDGTGRDKKSCNFRGAMVNLWTSKLAKERWGKGNVYDPPHRNWNFDQDFTNPSKAKPPAFPAGVQLGRTVYEEERWLDALP